VRFKVMPEYAGDSKIDGSQRTAAAAALSNEAVLAILRTPVFERDSHR